jgi:ADP-dependent NAD(P)H-hydrate dehydratase / NAD(P)H-hydrate epimerase
MVKTKKEMQEIEDWTIEMGTTISELMENAGRSVAESIEDKFSDDLKNKNILIVCGKGNNGGDGLVAARYLMDVCDNVEVLLLFGINEMSQESQENCEILVDMNPEKVHCLDEDSLMSLNTMKYDIIVDAMLGINCKGELQYPYSMITKYINASTKSFIVSIDIPSGLKADELPKEKSLYVNSTLIVTFHDTKPCLEFEEFKEKVIIKDIGLPF